MAFSIRSFALLALALIAISAQAFAAFTYVTEYNGSKTVMGNIVNMSAPAGMAMLNGTLYVADSENKMVYVIDQKGSVMERISGAGAQDGTLQKPVGLLINGRTLLIADRDQNTVYKYDTVVKGIEEFVPARREGKRPTAMALDGDELYIADAEIDQIIKYSYATKYLNGSFLSSGIGSNQISNPSGILVADGKIFISDKDNDRVLVFDKTWKYVDTLGRGRGNLTLLRPGGISYYNGLLYVADTLNNRIVVFGQDGYPIDVLGGKREAGNYSFNITSSVLATDGKLYVSDEGNHRVVVYNIEESQMAGQIKARIAADNVTISQINALRDQLVRVGGQPGQFDADARLSRAADRLATGQYGAADETLDSLENYLVQENVSTRQAIRIAVQKKIDSAKAGLAVVGNATLPKELDASRNAAKNAVIDAQAKADAGDWDAAIAATEKLQASVDVLDAKYAALVAEREKAAEPGKKPQEPQYDSAAVTAYGQALKGRLAALKDSQLRHGYTKDYVALDSLIDAGLTLANGGAYAQANSTFATAAVQIDKEEKGWDAALSASANASVALDKAKRIAAEGDAWEKLGANFTVVREKVAQAQAVIYTDPAKAEKLCNEAIEIGEKESSVGKTRGLAAGWLGAAMLGIVVVGGIVYFLYKRRQGRKGI